MKVSVVKVGGDRRMSVFGRLNVRWEESCEVEEGVSRIEGGILEEKMDELGGVTREIDQLLF